MSGGHFDYNQSLISEIADTIAIEIARALLPKPQKVHEDYWTIDEHNCPCSCHNYSGYREFKTYEEAESFLLWDKSIVPADHNYGVSFISKEDKVFRSTKLLMGGTVDWMLSGDDGEDTMQTRLKEELAEVQQEFDTKNWACPYEGWNEDE